jgi:hypothetical protein
VLNLAFAPSLVLIGHLLKLKYALGTLEYAYFSFNNVPFRPMHVGANVKLSINFATKQQLIKHNDKFSIQHFSGIWTVKAPPSVKTLKILDKDSKVRGRNILVGQASKGPIATKDEQLNIQCVNLIPQTVLVTVQCTVHVYQSSVP